MLTIKFLSAVLLGAANLAVAVPVETSPVTPLDKRIDFSIHNCGLDMYQSVGQRAVMLNLFYLKGVNLANYGLGRVGDTVIGTHGKCRMISCQGQAGVYLCVDPSSNSDNVPYVPSDLGAQLDATYHDCYGGPPADDDTAINAFQYWGKGYNLLVAGNADCSKRGQISN